MRSLARLTRAQRRAVAARGLSGRCARAFNGDPKTATLFEAFANALRDLRRAILVEDERMFERANARMERVGNMDLEDDDSVALLAACPRV